jgi:hypothetical protein
MLPDPGGVMTRWTRGTFVAALVALAVGFAK